MPRSGMDENELLLRHTATWASAKGRTLDHDLLATALALWTGREGHFAQLWPIGSAETLLLQHWPSHEPIRGQDVEVLVATLETFWRFLRGTGRLRSDSAEPKALAKEARRAAPKMVMVSDDPRPSGPVTIEEALTEWGEALVEDAEFDRELQEEIDEQDLYEQSRHDETWALLPDSHDGWAADPPLEASAREARQSPFIQECLRFARWVGDGRRITNGVLRPEQVREAQVEFKLGAWEREFLARSPLAHTAAPFSSSRHGHVPAGLLGELDHLVTTRALQSLWNACAATDLIQVGSTTARATSAADRAHTRSPDDWAELGQEALITAVMTRHFFEPLEPVLRVLFPFLREGVDRVEMSDVRDWWWVHEVNPWAGLGLGILQAHRSSDRQADRLLWAMDDTGLWQRDGETLHRTALGMDVAMRLMSDPSAFLDVG